MNYLINDIEVIIKKGISRIIESLNEKHLEESNRYCKMISSKSLKLNEYEVQLKEPKEINKKLLEALKEADTKICSFCKRINPHHEDCTSCSDRDELQMTIKNAEENLTIFETGIIVVSNTDGSCIRKGEEVYKKKSKEKENES